MCVCEEEIHEKIENKKDKRKTRDQKKKRREEKMKVSHADKQINR